MLIEDARHWPVAAVIGIVSLGAAPALAQNYDVSFTENSSATPIDLPRPDYPGSNVRRGQEGWVQVSYVIDAEGKAVDPIIIDSAGGSAFEKSARESLGEWRFEPSETELPFNTAEIRFEIFRGKDMATSNFLRRYKRIMTNVVREQNEAARRLVDETLERGGWNLYEMTLLCLMDGRVEGATGNDASKLEGYRRALGVSNARSLGGQNRRDTLKKIFEIEFATKQYGSALATFALLEAEPGNTAETEALADSVAEIEAAIADSAPFAAAATIYNPCNCDAGEPVWAYSPARRKFSFAELSGNVERFEARCEASRLSAPVEPGRKYELPGEWGSCQVYVFGDDGATFEFIEHSESEPDDKAGRTAVARNDVLDRPNRGQ